MQGPQNAGKAVYSLSLRAGRGLRTAAAGIRASSIPLALHANYILLKQEIYLWKSLFRNIFPQKDFLPRFLFEKYKFEGDARLHITGGGSEIISDKICG